MNTVFVQRDGDGAIVFYSAGPQPGMDLEELPEDNAAVVAFLNPPAPFPSLKKWQLWLAALELEPPIFKADVLSAVAGMSALSAAEKETMRIMIEDAQEYERADPRIDMLAQVMGIPPAQMDSLWAWAAQIRSM
ncbi:hypothetical protein EOS93_25150 [Rhizobium sp. RMa-01]|uniref:hypothetical protein n=1 Tax=unclassified Rhizobium TaxID=2613769 RepID=UPI0008DAFDEE|nr:MULTISPECIES: hypothetical protein [unclassified Rhizobium]OHV24951.1 hypothetical protein BBJ66_22685 [Rhizobium sp. RSm-3]RVU08343.1 hypothetical protein EOS93_25150 [Rhizobium sp. RMa-01]